MKNETVYNKYVINYWPCHFYTEEAVNKYNDKIEKYCQSLKAGSLDLSFWQKFKRRFYIAYLDIFDAFVHVFK